MTSFLLDGTDATAPGYTGLNLPVKLTDHVGIEDDHTLENTHDHGVLVPVFLGQDTAQLSDLFLDLLLGQEDLLDIVFL